MIRPKVKVLFCAPSPSNKGGITIWSKTLIDYFDSVGDDEYELILYPMDRSVSLSNLLPSYKRFCIAVKDYAPFPFHLFRMLCKKQFKIAHIASVGGWMGSLRDLIFVSMCSLFKVKSVVHYHCGTIPIFSKRNSWGWKLQARVIKYASKIIVLDDMSRMSLQNLGYMNVCKIPNPLPIGLKEVCKSKNRSEKSLLFVGHVVPTKGIFELLDAVRGLNITVNVFGPRNSEVDAAINKILTNSQFEAKIIFHGIQSSEVIYENMRKASLFVLPTYTEGFPLVIMEAMACGCPIITTPVGAIEEMLTLGDQKLGYLVPVGDTETLRNTICYCLSHPEETLYRASLAQEKVFSVYTLECVVDMLKEVWRS